MDKNKIAERLRTARGEKTCAEMAKTIGITRSALANYETGLRIPRDEVKNKLAEAYGTTVQALFFD